MLIDIKKKRFINVGLKYVVLRVGRRNGYPRLRNHLNIDLVRVQFYGALRSGIDVSINVAVYTG